MCEFFDNIIFIEIFKAYNLTNILNYWNNSYWLFIIIQDCLATNYYKTLKIMNNVKGYPNDISFIISSFVNYRTLSFFFDKFF